MKIKEVEARVGMTRANIRYYEKEGLLRTTVRNENNYREYTEEDIEQLQKIKILRLLGISPADIKLLNADAISMEEIMKKRVEELEREAKQIQDIHRICETIIDKQIDVHSLTEEILTGDRAVWMQRMEELIHKDIVNEVVTRKQVNSTIAGMLAWGYLICAAVTTFLFTIGNDSKIVEALFTNKKISGAIFDGYYGMNWALWGMAILTVIALFSIYYSANVVTHLISFHISAILLSPLLMGIFNRMPGGNVSGTTFAVLWLMLVAYIVLLYVLCLKWDKMFTQMRYTVLIAFIYTAICTVIAALTLKYWMGAMALLLLFTVFAGMKWTIAVTDRSTFNRYYAVRHAGSIMNIIGLVTWSVGYDNKR